jgi:hypothetical protein
VLLRRSALHFDSGTSRSRLDAQPQRNRSVSRHVAFGRKGRKRASRSCEGSSHLGHPVHSGPLFDADRDRSDVIEVPVDGHDALAFVDGFDQPEAESAQDHG